MTFKISAQKAINSLFTKLGEQAIYTPNGGDAVSITVIKRQPDEILDVMETRIHTGTCVFDVRGTEVSAPAEGDTIAINGKTFITQGESVKDQHGLLWRIAVHEA